MDYTLKYNLFQGDFPVFKGSKLLTQTVHLTLAQVLMLKNAMRVTGEVGGEVIEQSGVNVGGLPTLKRDVNVGGLVVPKGSVLLDRLPSKRDIDPLFRSPVETFLKFYAPGTVVTVKID